MLKAPVPRCDVRITLWFPCALKTFQTLSNGPSFFQPITRLLVSFPTFTASPHLCKIEDSLMKCSWLTTVALIPRLPSLSRWLQRSQRFSYFGHQYAEGKVRRYEKGLRPPWDGCNYLPMRTVRLRFKNSPSSNRPW